MSAIVMNENIPPEEPTMADRSPLHWGAAEHPITEVPRAIGKLVILRVEAVEARTKGGVWLDPIGKDIRERHQDVGWIVEFGPFAFHEVKGPEAWGLQVGDRVLFAKDTAKPVQVPGCDPLLRIVEDKNIQARLDKVEDTDG